MYFRKICSIIFFCCFILGGSATGFGARFEVENGNVYGHKTLNGETVFLTAYQIPHNLFRSSSSYFYLQKVFGQNEQPYYYCYMSFTNSKLKKNPAVKMNVRINDKEINLLPLENFKSGLEGETFSGWYKINEPDIDEMLKSLQSMHFVFSDDSKVVKDIKVSEKRLPPFVRLADIAKEDYIREGIVFAEAKDSVKDIITPQVYLPNVKPEAVRWAIFMKLAEKSKEEYSPYHIWRIWQGDNPLLFALEGGENIDNSNSFTTFVTTPYKDGVLLKMYKNQKHYTSHKTKYGSDWSNHLTKMVKSYGGFVNMCDYWRSISEDWDKLFFEVYTDLYGQTDYGFDYAEEKAKDGKGNTFYLKKIDAEQFPELTGFNEGDTLKSVDGANTAYMCYMDLKYKLITGDKPINVVITDKAGSEKQIMLKPKFKPTQLKPIDINGSPLEKMKVNHDDQGFVYDQGAYTYLFDPIEPRLENEVKTEERVESTEELREETVK